MHDELTRALEKRSLKALLKVIEGGELDRTNDLGVALHHAISMRNHDFAQALLAAGADIDITFGQTGYSPLYTLIDSRSGVMNATELANAEWLIAQGADVNLKTHRGMNSLHLAAATAPLEFVKLLMKKGAKVIRDKQGETPLFRGVSTNDKSDDVWAFFLANGCSVDDVNKEKQTILHLARENANTSALKFFLRQGADPSKRDANGEVAIDLSQPGSKWSNQFKNYVKPRTLVSRRKKP